MRTLFLSYLFRKRDGRDLSDLLRRNPEIFTGSRARGDASQNLAADQ